MNVTGYNANRHDVSPFSRHGSQCIVGKADRTFCGVVVLMEVSHIFLGAYLTVVVWTAWMHRNPDLLTFTTCNLHLIPWSRQSMGIRSTNNPKVEWEGWEEDEGR